ncbi:MAG: hypothetical protein ACE5II_03140 [Anaerolineae bacterium]
MKEASHPIEDGKVPLLALWLGIWLLTVGFIVAFREAAWSVPFPRMLKDAERTSFSSQEVEQALDLEAFPLLPSPGEVLVESEQPEEEEPSSPLTFEPSDVEVAETALLRLQRTPPPPGSSYPRSTSIAR